MPLVISKKAKKVFVIRNEEWLGEILGHSNFDGENWAIGDEIVFEDGMTAEIIQSEDKHFYVWSDPKESQLSEVLDLLGRVARIDDSTKSEIRTWQELFMKIRPLASLRYA